MYGILVLESILLIIAISAVTIVLLLRRVFRKPTRNISTRTTTFTSHSHFDAMDGHEFERFCADLLLKNGFAKAEVTRGSGDHGVDILAEKDGLTYAIQCKRQSSNVGNKAVQEIYSGRTFYGRNVGAVLTNQYFTQNAKEAAQRTGIILWGRDWLEKSVANREGGEESI